MSTAIVRDARGSGLAWAMVTLLLVATSAAAIASSVGRTARLVRHQQEIAALDDLRRAGRALAAARLRDAAWSGAETIELAGGTISLQRPASGASASASAPAPASASLASLTLRARLTGREVTLEIAGAPTSR